MTTTSKQYTLVLDEEQRAELQRVLEDARIETHVELRRTDTPAYRETVHHEEALLQKLTEMVRNLK